ncbi:hypothetical protein PVW46_16920 [Mameliella sp. AT18]|uniref:hypothetical protein n=1 Tax=Mameliella sp. AT18 TaxID=3028385 RepID=UPI0008411052|nr:hypothetical protein [Mameliella sp. AT18]MDD9731588.1 hypothetical protein [Mameliella sp. AT18]ODM47228.1 hypothetical protein A9320_23205 [Ruegeria sp. PBVC088]
MERDEVAQLILRQAGEIHALKTVLAQLIARLAADHPDTEGYVLTLTAGVRGASEATDLPPAMLDAMEGVADMIEDMALND